MSLIACTDPCVYQKDGCCSLSRAASIGQSGGGGCINFVPRSGYPRSQHDSQRFPDVGHTDHL